MTIKIIVADDHTLMREALCSKLDTRSELEIIAQADNGREAIGLCQKHIPDVIVMDVSMPGLNGIEATRRIHNNNPNIKIIALSMHSEQKFVVDMLKAGAAGYLNKACRFEELVEAIKIIMSGEIYLDRSIGTKVVRDYLCTKSQNEDGSENLTGREREVLQLIAEGKSSKGIAYSLKISENTIVSHRQKIMNKLNIRSIAELTKYAIREGITPLEA